MGKPMQLAEPLLTYGATENRDVLTLINAIRKGINYAFFVNIAQKSPFTIPEWSNFLHLSERTMQRYKNEQKTFDPIYSEKIIEITMLYKFGVEVFGNNEKFNSWLEANNLALGGIKPKDILDSSFGINLLKDELTAIEHGILA